MNIWQILSMKHWKQNRYLQLTIDDKDKYDILRKIGIDEKIINKAIFKQIGIFFLFPLLIAIMHSVVGFKIENNMLEMFGKNNILVLALLIYGQIGFIWYNINIYKMKNR